MESITSNEANRSLNNKVIELIRKLLNDGQMAINNGLKTEVKEIDGVGAFILNQDEEKYNALQLLQTIINFNGEVPKDKLYVIPGTLFGTESGIKSHSIALPMAKLEELADKAEYLEDKLHEYGLRFPSELFRYQKKYKNTNLPGRDFPAPLPRRMDQTTDEYETYLEEYYKNHGVEKKSDGLAFRHPYDHEKIDYRKGNKEEPGYTSSSYSSTQKEKAEGKGKTTTAPVGERIRVTSRTVKGPSLRQRSKDVVETRIEWAKIGSAILKTAAVAGGVFLAAKLLGVSPLGWAIIGGGAAVFAVTRYLRRRYDRKRALRAYEEEEAKKQKEKEIEEAKDKAKEKEKEKETGGPTETKEPPTKTGPVPPAPGPKPGSTPGSAPDGTTTGTPSGSPSGEPASDEPAYDMEKLLQGEREIDLDIQEYFRIQSEIVLLVSQYEVAKESGELSADELREFKERLSEKQRQRAQIGDILAARQGDIVETAGLGPHRR